MLETILHEAAAVLTEAHVLRESIRSALAYPLFLLAATIFSLLLMTVFILPIFAALLRDLGAEAPLPTRVMLALSDALAAHPYALIATVIGGLPCRSFAVGTACAAPSCRCVASAHPCAGDILAARCVADHSADARDSPQERHSSGSRCGTCTIHDGESCARRLSRANGAKPC